MLIVRLNPPNHGGAVWEYICKKEHLNDVKNRWDRQGARYQYTDVEPHIIMEGYPDKDFIWEVFQLNNETSYKNYNFAILLTHNNRDYYVSFPWEDSSIFDYLKIRLQSHCIIWKDFDWSSVDSIVEYNGGKPWGAY